MHPVDLVFVLLLLAVQPVHGYIEARRYTALYEAGRSIDRVGFYRGTALIEWAFLAALGAAWLTLDRPVEALGFVAPGGRGFWIGVVLVAVFTGILFYAWSKAKTADDAETAKQIESLGTVVQFVPHTAREMRGFVGVSITAGIVEEIVYRGFLLWYLAHFMPVWVAVVASSVVFGLGHSYQGAQGASRAGLVGLAFGMLYVGTGSIWLPILAHALLDILQGAAIYTLLRKRNDTWSPHPA